MPIDTDFLEKYPVVGEHAGHAVRGEVKPPEELGVHCTNVAVDHDCCDGDGVCISFRPVDVFDLVDSLGTQCQRRSLTQ